MTQEEKILLLKDLCARLIYGVKVDINFWNSTKELNCSLLQDCIVEEKVLRPYLRPMSSMTEDERRESKEWIILSIDSNHNKKYFDGFGNISAEDTLKAIDWLNSHMFDYRGLIEKGLALPAPKEMYKYD